MSSAGMGKYDEAEAGVADLSLGDDDEVLAAPTPASAADAKFDEIVGVLEAIIMEPEFRDKHETFCRENCHHFDYGENKLICTDLFTRYTEITEHYIEAKLAESVEGFDMAEFAEMLEARADELMGDVFDILMGFGDFEEFKSLMLSYKEQVAHEHGDAASSGMSAVAPTVISLDVAGAPLGRTATGSASAERMPQLSGATTAGAGAGDATGAQLAGADSSQAVQTQGQIASETGAAAATASGGPITTGATTAEGLTGERS